MAIGLALPATGIVGAGVLAAVGAVYLVRLAAPSRRSAVVLGAFLLFGSWAVAVLLLRTLG